MKINTLLALLTYSVLTVSCGDAGEDTDDRLLSSTIAVTPPDIPLTVGDLMGNCFAVNTGFDVDQVFQASLRDVNDQPLEDVELSIIVDFGANNSQLIPVTQLWDDVNQNGIIDEGVDELASEENDGFLNIKTNGQGVARFILRYSSGCEYRANLLVLSNGGPEFIVSVEVSSEEDI